LTFGMDEDGQRQPDKFLAPIRVHFARSRIRLDDESRFKIGDDQPVTGGIKNASIPLFIFFRRMGGQAFIHNDYRLLSSMA